MGFVPGILSFCAKLTGIVSEAEVEIFTQKSYFMFQLVQVFLIRTITDTAATAFIQIVQSPTRVFSVLAEALPTSSNFYMSYFIVEGLMVAVDVMTQVVSFVVSKVVYKYLAKTPRSMYERWTTLKPISFAESLPVFTGIVVISKSSALSLETRVTKINFYQVFLMLLLLHSYFFGQQLASVSIIERTDTVFSLSIMYQSTPGD